MRYKNSRVKPASSGKTILATTLYPRIKNRSTDTFLIIVEKTRLDHLAQRFYENSNYWWIIAIANRIKGTLYVTPGTQLRIPRDVSQIMHDYNRVNKR